MAVEAPRRGQLMSQINVTPLVDVMLVLLVIFMITAPIIQQGVQLNLPQVRAAPLAGSEEQFVVSVTRTGEVYLNDQRYDRDELTAKLVAIARERPDRQIFVRADEKVEYGEVIRVMAAIKAAGIENVGMVTAMPPDGDQPRTRNRPGSAAASP
jgi:biopolymer transport protein TolR